MRSITYVHTAPNAINIHAIKPVYQNRASITSSSSPLLTHRSGLSPLTQPAREVWDRQRAIGGFPMTRDEENREILIGVAIFLTFVVLLVLYRRFLS
jgi:hypothetical protein